ncbi:MAG: gamma-glutamyltransferase [Ignavibacteria bacterium]|nr:gamma-glutamyltransferase [Ignavibacteria bacterium]
MLKKISFITLILIIFCYSVIFSQYKNGVVSSANELASDAGIKVLQKGGNAVDAAVAAAFVLAVVYPQAGNIGGGGFIVARLSDGKTLSIDFREKAPLLSSKTMFLDSEGNVVPDLSTTTHLASGVPGSVAGLLYALEKYGTMKRSDVLSYAIDFAENGFRINKELADAINNHRNEFRQFQGSALIFDRRFTEGDLFVQMELAAVLKNISEFGRDGFYKGRTADLIVNEMKRGNGIISYSDLENYKPVERNVLKGTYRDFELITMGPPSSGGICLLYLLNLLEMFDVKATGYNNVYFINMMAEAMKLVYADRGEYMGDADFVSIPVNTLISKAYAKERFGNYTPGISVPSDKISYGKINVKDKPQTTHISVADSKGNMVALTTTLNDVFGNKIVVEGAGFLLNNEMDDFSIKPGYPNIYGLIGSDANSIEPGKRMLSSMTPTIIVKNGSPFMVIGSPGGGKIITSVLQTVVNVVDFGFDIHLAVDAPRIHHQLYPDILQFERDRLKQDVAASLKSFGYELKQVSDFGRVEAILFDTNGTMSGHSDRRGSGKAFGY